MRAHKKEPLLVRVTSGGKVIGHLTCDQFRQGMGIKQGFIGDLVNRFNRDKEQLGEPERAEQVIQLANGKTI